MKAIFLITLLLVTFGYLEQVNGSCLSYGHSCWGGHGKRSGHPIADVHRANLAKRLSLAQRFAQLNQLALTDNCEDGSTEGAENADGTKSTNCGGATKPPQHATSPKRASPLNYQTNAEEFLEAMESLPPSEEDLVQKDDDDQRWNAIRAMNPSLRRFFAQATN